MMLKPPEATPESESIDLLSGGMKIIHQPDKIKLLKFVNIFDVGGTERQFVTLGRALDSSRFELHFACLRRHGRLLKELEALQIPVAEYNIKSLYHRKTFQDQIKFAGYLRRNRIQIVHTYGVYPNLFAIPPSKLARVPVVVASIRDTGAYLTPMQRRAQKLICRLADCIAVNADAVRDWLVAGGYDRQKIAVIKNGIDLSRFSKPGKRQQFRQELGVPPHVPLVAVLSRLSPVKGIEYFLEAAGIVAKQSPKTLFVIVGDGHIEGDRVYRKELERYAAYLGLRGRVFFAGFRLDVPELLSEATVSVLPSLSEGLSNTVLESMAAGVPVVATRVGGTPEAIEDGVTGLLVRPRDPAALAQAILRLVENHELAMSFGRAGKQRIVKYFSLERMVRETEQLYLRLLEKARNRNPALLESHPAMF